MPDQPRKFAWISPRLISAAAAAVVLILLWQFFTSDSPQQPQAPAATQSAPAPTFVQSEVITPTPGVRSQIIMTPGVKYTLVTNQLITDEHSGVIAGCYAYWTEQDAEKRVYCASGKPDPKYWPYQEPMPGPSGFKAKRGNAVFLVALNEDVIYVYNLVSPKP